MNHADGPRQGDRQPPEGPPSAQARSSLSEDLRREVAEARLRFEEAGMRAEAHRLLGDPEGAAEVVREQERILADVQARLGRVVSSAVVQRDAEQVFADVAATATAEDASWLEPVPAAPDDRPRSPALAGVASVVAVLGVAAAALFGVVRGFPPVEIAEVAADAPTDQTAVDRPSPTADAPQAGPAAPLPGPPAPTAADPTAEAGSTPDGAMPTRGTTPTDDPTEETSPVPVPDPELDAVVQELVDAVAGLGGSDDDATDPETPSEDVDASVGELDTLVDELDDGPGADDADGVAPDADGDLAPDTDGDGFVPGAAAQ